MPHCIPALHYSARARWISHVIDFLGDPTDEFRPSPGNELPHRPEFLVLEHGPQKDRDYYTYLTAGLGLCPQLPTGPMPYLELISCSPTRDPRVGQFLFMMSHDIASAGPDDTAFKAYDLWGAPLWGMCHFVLVPAREPAGLLDFPNPTKRSEDDRYVMAATGEASDQMVLDILQIVPLTDAEWREATGEGSPNLLQRIGWEKQPKTYGWSAIDPRRV